MAFTARSVLMPEAASNLYYFLPAAKHKVGLTWKIRGVKPIPVTHPVSDRTDRQLWLHSLALDLPHVLAAPESGEDIHEVSA